MGGRAAQEAPACSWLPVGVYNTHGHFKGRRRKKTAFNWATSLVSIWLIKERYYLQISRSRSYFLLVKKWFNEKKKNQGSRTEIIFFSPNALSGPGCFAKNAWTIGFWHEDWNLNSMKKSRKPSSPHYLMLARRQSKRWVMILGLCKRGGRPRPWHSH